MNMRSVGVLVLLLLTLSGCGIISVGYNYADVYLRYSVNRYTTFNDVQKELIRTEVDAYMLWHRRNMLPEYVEYLQELQRIAQSAAPLLKEDVRRLRIALREKYVRTLVPAIAPAAKVLSGLDKAQIQEMAQTLASEIDKQKHKELDGSMEDQLHRRGEKTIDFVEDLVGVLDAKQLKKIREMNLVLPYATGLYIAQREDNQGRLIEYLHSGKSEAEIAALMAAWLRTPDADRSDEEQKIMRSFEDGADEMIANIYQMLSGKQKKALLKNIAKFITTFEALASAKVDG